MTDTVAVWYLHHGQPDYDLVADAAEAADTAASITLHTDDIVLGAQFRDGPLVHEAVWTAYQERVQHLKLRLAEERSQWVAPPTRETRCPFTGGTIKIEVTEPAWLGAP
jgi:hypothetical protein